ncbi:MAG: AAA family ATPase [Eubacteriales bacterium]|nr:AAA family ATPase [Eubacteriales bacterium]
MPFRIQSVDLENYGNISSFKCSDFSNINLIIGENATGKTFLLKALYSAIRSMEDYRRGDDVRPINDILSEKLRWTFQVEKLGDIVNRSARDSLHFMVKTDHEQNCLEYQFSQSANTKVGSVSAPGGQKEGNSIFIPAKEVLSLFSVILKSREVDRSFGFDDTYYDLVKALRVAPSRGKNFAAFSDARKELKAVISGQVDYEEDSGRWYYKNKANQKFSIGATAEGVKKISIMDRLLSNGYINKESVLFIDELESALHPNAICDFLDMIANISNKMGIQVFISTHSYFVVKKLFLIALKYPGDVTCISLSKNDKPKICNLSDGMPENSIIQASIELYKQEITEVL